MHDNRSSATFKVKVVVSNSMRRKYKSLTRLELYNNAWLMQHNFSTFALIKGNHQTEALVSGVLVAFSADLDIENKTSKGIGERDVIARKQITEHLQLQCVIFEMSSESCMHICADVLKDGEKDVIPLWILLNNLRGVGDPL